MSSPGTISTSGTHSSETTHAGYVFAHTPDMPVCPHCAARDSKDAPPVSGVSDLAGMINTKPASRRGKTPVAPKKAGMGEYGTLPLTREECEAARNSGDPYDLPEERWPHEQGVDARIADANRYMEAAEWLISKILLVPVVTVTDGPHIRYMRDPALARVFKPMVRDAKR